MEILGEQVFLDRPWFDPWRSMAEAQDPVPHLTGRMTDTPPAMKKPARLHLLELPLDILKTILKEVSHATSRLPIHLVDGSIASPDERSRRSCSYEFHAPWPCVRKFPAIFLSFAQIPKLHGTGLIQVHVEICFKASVSILIDEY